MPKNIAADVIAKFGGLEKASEAIGAPKSTVQSWRKAGRIPSWRKPQVIAAADRIGVALPSKYTASRAA